MMTRRVLFLYVDAEPFRPFRIKMTSGETFEIRYPETIYLSRTTARVFSWLDETGESQEREISVLLIESIEPLPQGATQQHPAS